MERRACSSWRMAAWSSRAGATWQEGAPEPVPAERLLALSDVVLPGVMSCDRRKGAAAAGLRAGGVEATLAPLDGVAPHEL
eukprot:6178828-Pleurochrysis_carterae.AAC.1